MRSTGRLPLVLLLVATPAIAEAGPRAASRGIFTEAGLGATGFLTPSRGHSEIGPNLALRAGYDLFSWFSIGVHLVASSHEATVPPPPEGEWYQLYRGHGDGRIGLRAGRVGVFVEGGVGAAYINTNVLGKVGITDPGEHYGLAFNAGGGLEYQIDNRHYAFGVAGDWWLIPEFAALSGVETRVYLRYTY